MAALIVPRPIAWVTTLGPAGVVNAAPFSLFNMVGEDPPLVMVSVAKGPGGRLKDTAAMHACGAALPPEASELDAAGLRAVPSVAVAPPRIAGAPVAFECRLAETIENTGRHVFFGEVLHLHAREGLLDLDRHRVHLAQYFPLGRFGSSLYVRTRERFEMVGAGRDAG
jgi:flavin reductase (DIM6/NTAB) family NADH-FMN oxidoreductase RutF